MSPAKTTKTQWYHATGKRKNAVARVFLKEGAGNITVNKKPIEEYFPILSLQEICRQAFQATGTVGRFEGHINVKGGGVSAQAEATRHGISKLLAELDPTNFRIPLKKAGFLSRDAREKERKKYGQPGARKKFQYSKR